MRQKKRLGFVLLGPKDTFWEVGMLLDWMKVIDWMCCGRQPLRQRWTLLSITYVMSIPRMESRAFTAAAPHWFSVHCYCRYVIAFMPGQIPITFLFSFLLDTSHVFNGLSYCHGWHICLYITWWLCAWFLICKALSSNMCRGTMRILEEANIDDGKHDDDRPWSAIVWLIHGEKHTELSILSSSEEIGEEEKCVYVGNTSGRGRTW